MIESYLGGRTEAPPVLLRSGWKTAEQGAATPTFVAASRLLDGIGGRYFEDCNESGPNEPGISRGFAPHAVDAEAAQRLWQISRDAIAA